MIAGECRNKLIQVMDHMRSTTDDQWLMDRVSSQDNSKLCCLGHVFFMGGNDDAACNDWWEWFEFAVATEFMIFPVNDGAHPDYRQATAKARILAYLQDVLDGKRKTTCELMAEEMTAYESSLEATA